MQRYVVALFVALALPGATQSPSGTAAPADLILHNARIYTVSAARPRAEAVAVRADRIVSVGRTADVLALRGPATRVLDLQGAVMVPGLADAHGHFLGLGQGLQRLDFRGTTSYEQIVEMVRKAATRPARVSGFSGDHGIRTTGRTSASPRPPSSTPPLRTTPST